MKKVVPKIAGVDPEFAFVVEIVPPVVISRIQCPCDYYDYLYVVVRPDTAKRQQANYCTVMM